MNNPRHFKAPFIAKERIWQEADRLRAAHQAGRELPVKVLDLAEFDLHLDLVPVSGLREQLAPAIPTGWPPTKPRSITSRRASRQSSASRRKWLRNGCEWKNCGRQYRLDEKVVKTLIGGERLQNVVLSSRFSGD